MQTSTLNISDISNTQHPKYNTPVIKEQATQVENKKTEFVEKNKKLQSKLIEREYLEKSQKTLKEKGNQKIEIRIEKEKKINQSLSDTKLERNLSETKIAERKISETNENYDDVSSSIAQLEASKTYTKGVSKKQTALEVATSKADILKSVKTVKPDGTEQYHFPVPVEILAKLPPPGNIGISASKMAEIIGKNKENAITNSSSNQNIEFFLKELQNQNRKTSIPLNAEYYKFNDLNQLKIQQSYDLFDLGKP